MSNRTRFEAFLLEPSTTGKSQQENLHGNRTDGEKKNHCSLEPDFGTTQLFLAHPHTQGSSTQIMDFNRGEFFSVSDSTFRMVRNLADLGGKHYSVPCTVERDHGSANRTIRTSGKFNFSSETSYTTCASRDSEQEHRRQLEIFAIRWMVW